MTSQSIAVKILIVLAAAALSFGGGWLSGRAVLSTTFALEKANAVLAAEQAVREQLEEQKRLGDMLSDQLSAAEASIDKLKKEKIHALLQTTTGRVCFNADTVGVLNNKAATTAAVPDTPRTSDAGSRRPAASQTSESALTDTDVAFWIANAQSQYSVCQSRLKALIAFERMR